MNIKNGAGRNERTTTQTDPFQANPLGRGQLADFPRCSLLTYRLRYARRYRQSGSDRLENLLGYSSSIRNPEHFSPEIKIAKQWLKCA